MRQFKIIQFWIKDHKIRVSHKALLIVEKAINNQKAIRINIDINLILFK